MSFSMDSIKRKSTTKQKYIKECDYILKTFDILTANTKYALWKYAEYRFTQRNRGLFDGQIFEDMIWELLVYCCNKSKLSISRQDVINNENSIIYEVKKAIYYGATRCLFDKNNTVIQLDKSFFSDNIDEPKQLPGTRTLELEEVKDYFKDLVIC